MISTRCAGGRLCLDPAPPPAADVTWPPSTLTSPWRLQDRWDTNIIKKGTVCPFFLPSILLFSLFFLYSWPQQKCPIIIIELKYEV